jgi:DNA adenine methylase
MKMKTKIIGYFGGKGGKLSTVIKSFIPDDYKIYLEPYGGSASILFTQQAPIEIYNDIYDNVYSLFKVLSNKDLFRQLKEKIDITPYSEKLNKEYKLKLKEDGLSLLDRAYYYFYVNKTSVNAIGGFSINTIVRRKISKSTSDYLSVIDGLEHYNERLSNVVVLNRPALDVIEKYDREETFIYLDPPYVHSTRTSARYACDMEDEEHIKLIDTVLKCKSKILISGYDNELYDRLVDNGWNKYSFDIKTTDGKNRPKVKTEVLWYNYEKKDI